ncbi:high mobility group B protein 14 [Fagus crenata]
MAKKKAKKSSKQKSASSSPPPASAKPPQTASNHKMVLRVKSSVGMKRSVTLSRVSEEDKRPNSPKSAKKPKPKQQKKKIEKFDAKKPKKPPTAFFYFLEDFRKEFQVQNPDVKSMRDIGKAGGEKWKTMTYEEKVQYYDIATGKRADFDRAMADYIKQKESGEDQETKDSDTESEFDE